MKKGKKSAVPKETDFRFSRYYSAEIDDVIIPTRFGYGLIYANWRMLGNDNAGDCVIAGGAHETMLFNRVRRGLDVRFTDASVLSDYSAVTGYDPNDPSSDQGALVSDALAYRRKTGLLDAEGARHTIAAYVSIDPKNWTQLLQATYLFGTVGIGFEFPEIADTQFGNGEPWDATEDDGPIIGGHYVPVVGSLSSTEEVSTVSWAKRQRMTRAFYEKYNDEAWAFISWEAVIGFHKFDLGKLTKDLAALAA